MRATVRVPKPRWRCWISRRCWRWRIVTLWPPPSSGWLWLGESRERRQGLRRWRGRGRLSRPKLSPAEREDTRLPHLVRGHQETHYLTIPYSTSTNKTLALNKVLLFFFLQIYNEVAKCLKYLDKTVPAAAKSWPYWDEAKLWGRKPVEPRFS